jgi:acid phosphatase (class A)
LADTEESVFRFADVMGPGFNRESLPFAAKFFRQLSVDADDALAVAKRHFNRPRPFAVDHEIESLVGEPSTPSYPGGHATFAYVNAIVLSYIVPERTEAIFDRARTYAYNPVIVGVHYPSDQEAGLISAAVIANTLLHQPKFQEDLSRVRVEVRRAIGLRQ